MSKYKYLHISDEYDSCFINMDYVLYVEAYKESENSYIIKFVLKNCKEKIFVYETQKEYEQKLYELKPYLR